MLKNGFPDKQFLFLLQTASGKQVILHPNIPLIMKKFIGILILLVTVLAVRGKNSGSDTSYWKSKYESALGFSQTSLSNWAKGGEKWSFSSNFILNIYKDYHREALSWNNYLGITYGIARMQSVKKLRKTDDKINLVTKCGVKAWKHWDYTGFFEFKSQFSEGFAYPNDSVHISGFLAPAYFQLSAGLNYKLADYFAVFVSPMGARLTLVNDTELTSRPEGAYGVHNGEITLWQVGGSVNAIFKKDILKNVNLLSKLDVFTNFSERPDKVVISWENNLLMKVNKYVSVNLSTTLIYDEKAVPENSGNTFRDILQYRETFGFGLAYTLFR
jgi:hypothetical protein